MFETMIYYTGQGLLYLDQAKTYIIMIFLLVLAIQLGRIHHELSSVCRKIRRYFAVITKEEAEDKPSAKETGQEELVGEFRRNKKKVPLVDPESERRKQKEAQDFMEILEEVL